MNCADVNFSLLTSPSMNSKARCAIDRPVPDPSHPRRWPVDAAMRALAKARSRFGACELMCAIGSLQAPENHMTAASWPLPFEEPPITRSCAVSRGDAIYPLPRILFSLGWVHERVHDPAYDRQNKEQHGECDRPRGPPGAHPRPEQSGSSPRLFAVAMPEQATIKISRGSAVREARRSAMVFYSFKSDA